MRKRRTAIVCAALTAVFPLTSHAAVFTLIFDINDLKICSTETGTYVSPSAVNGASLSGTPSAPILNLPAGYFVEYGLDASISDNDGLGITGFQVGVNDSNPSIAGVVRPNQHVVVNPYFKHVEGKGTGDGSGGIDAAIGTVGVFLAVTQSTPTVYGVNSPGELFNSMVIAPTGTGKDVFTVTANLAAFSGAIYTGLSSSGDATYANRTFVPGVDTLSPLPALTLNIGVPEPTTAALAAVGAAALLIKRKKR